MEGGGRLEKVALEVSVVQALSRRFVFENRISAISLDLKIFTEHNKNQSAVSSDPNKNLFSSLRGIVLFREAFRPILTACVRFGHIKLLLISLKSNHADEWCNSNANDERFVSLTSVASIHINRELNFTASVESFDDIKRN